MTNSDNIGVFLDLENLKALEDGVSSGKYTAYDAKELIGLSESGMGPADIVNARLLGSPEAAKFERSGGTQPESWAADTKKALEDLGVSVGDAVMQRPLELGEDVYVQWFDGGGSVVPQPNVAPAAGMGVKP